MIVDRIHRQRISEVTPLGQLDEVALEVKRRLQTCKLEVLPLHTIGARHRRGMENATTDVNVVRVGIRVLHAPIQIIFYLLYNRVAQQDAGL